MLTFHYLSNYDASGTFFLSLLKLQVYSKKSIFYSILLHRYVTQNLIGSHLVHYQIWKQCGKVLLYLAMMQQSYSHIVTTLMLFHSWCETSFSFLGNLATNIRDYYVNLLKSGMVGRQQIISYSLTGITRLQRCIFIYKDRGKKVWLLFKYFRRWADTDVMLQLYKECRLKSVFFILLFCYFLRIARLTNVKSVTFETSVQDFFRYSGGQ